MEQVIIFGANKGIGLALARKFCDEGHSVVTINRSESSELSNLPSQDFFGIDVQKTKDLDQVLLKLDHCKFDCLIHNAGIWSDEDLFSKEMNFEDLTHVFEVNSIAPLKVINRFHGLLNSHAKIGLMSSRMGSVTDNDSGSRYGYRMSKAALNAAGKSLSLDLKPRQIAVAVLHPGYVRTDMTNNNGLINPDESAEGIYKVLTELNFSNTGQFWHSNGENLPW